MDATLILAYVIAGIVCLIILFTVLLYVIPVRSVLRITIDETASRNTLTASWCFIGLRIDQGPDGRVVEILACGRILYATEFGAKGEAAAPTQGKKAPGSTRISPRLTSRLILRLIRSFGSLGSVFWQECRFERAQGKLSLGLGDPAITGMFYGYYWAARFVLEEARIYIEIEPVFDREVFLGELEVHMNLHHPLRIIIAAIRLMRDPAVRNTAEVFRKGTPQGAAVV